MQIDVIRKAAENDLVKFIQLVAPKQVLGSVHNELCRWWTRQEARKHQITMLPRDHGKSRLIAYRVAWEITRRPEVRVLYISSTAALAEKQLAFIKEILDSKIYRRYWPEMTHPEIGQRKKWTNSEIWIDHPKRLEEAVADPTVLTGGLTTSLTGFHCDIVVMDDVVVQENAYTEDGRNKVKSQYSLLASIAGAEASTWVVGTRYHPKDLYQDLLTMTMDVYDDGDNVVEQQNVYEIFERQVEDIGDGTGEFLWPRQQRSDGKWFGFDRKILATKRAQYLDRTQFRAQYYNDPNDPDSMAIDRGKFQYYDKRWLSREGGLWYYKGSRLNLVASIDFGASVSKRADYTVIAVAGIDARNNIYVLDIDRFKTDRIVETYEHVLSTHTKWGYNKLIAEATAAQNVVVKELKHEYIRANGLLISITEVRPTKHSGSKAERLATILEPKYDNQSIWHYEGGNCQILEDELVMQNPPHDDCKDALATAIQHLVPPSDVQRFAGSGGPAVVKYHNRFGGVSF